MKKKLLLILLTLMLAFPFLSHAQTTDDLKIAGVTLKQAVIYPYKSEDLQNVTAFTIARTRKVESWGRWNALWEGWMVDVGVVYDSPNVDGAALLFGRNLGVLGDYLPIDFPLSDKIKIDIYPIGVYLEDFSTMDKQTCSGFSYLGATINF